MEQHPVPQHISSYEFRLVGNMTLKQFGLLAGPCLVALLFYAVPLPGYLKWPAVFFFVFLGAAMAFLPIEERPLDRWLVAFFKAVYSPTQYIWRKQIQKPAVFEEEPAKKTEPKPVVSPDQAKLDQYLQTLPVTQTPLEEKEESFLEKISHLFQTTDRLPQIPLEPKTEPKPAEPGPEPKKALKPKAAPAPVKKVATPQPQLRPVGRPQPTTKPIRLKIEPIKKEATAIEAAFSQELPIPQAPQSPNLLVGMVLNSKGKIIEGAILEIRDSQGIPVRALKTNKLGQFRIATPLKNGVYEIETEKEGYLFDLIKLAIKGEIIPPIEIRAKGAAHDA